MIRGDIAISALDLIAQDKDINNPLTVIPDVQVTADGTKVIDMRCDFSPNMASSLLDIGPYYEVPANVSNLFPESQKISGGRIGVIADRWANMGDDLRHEYRAFGFSTATRERSWRVIVSPV